MLEWSNLKPSEPHTDAAHLRLIRELPCLACGAKPAEAAHVRYSDAARGRINPGMGRRPPDRDAVPLCPKCHRMGKRCQHDGNERVWWEHHGINPHDVADALHKASVAGRAHGPAGTETIELMTMIVRKARRGMR